MSVTAISDNIWASEYMSVTAISDNIWASDCVSGVEDNLG